MSVVEVACPSCGAAMQVTWVLAGMPVPGSRPTKVDVAPRSALASCAGCATTVRGAIVGGRLSADGTRIVGGWFEAQGVAA